MTQPLVLEIEDEIRATDELESSAVATSTPKIVARDITLFDGEEAHTDSGVDVVVVVDVDIDEDILSAVDVDIDVDVDVDTHVDK